MEQEFHIIIGTSPAVGVDLANDLRLVKAAILYGDKAKLFSTASSLLLMTQRFGQMKANQQFDLIVSVLPYLIEDPAELQQLNFGVALYRQMARKKHKGAREFQIETDMRKGIKELWDKAVLQHSNFMQPESVRGIEKAITEGLLEVHFFEKFKDTSETVKNLVNDSLKNRENVRELMYEYLDLVTGAVQSGETYPMFDDETGKMLKHFVDAGTMLASPARVAQGRQSALAADLLRRLPVFDDATVHEVIDVRRELERPLVRFRGAVSGYAEKIKAASWDEDFSVEAEQVFRRDIEPSVLEIEDAVKSNSSLLSMTTRKLADKNVLLTSLFSFFVSNFTDLPQITQLMLAAGLGGAATAIEVWNEWHSQNAAVEKNQLYFYYGAKTMLSEGSFAYRPNV